MAVLDLELNVNRKTKKVEFNVFYKKTNTNITIKKRSNHKETVKKGVIKGYADRAKALCDPDQILTELNNIQEVFMESGCTKKEVNKAMRAKRRIAKEEVVTRGILPLPNIPDFTPRFNIPYWLKQYRLKFSSAKIFVTSQKFRQF